MAVSLTLASTHNNIDNNGSDHSHSPASLPPPTPLSPHAPYHLSNSNGSRPGTADSASKQTSISSPTAVTAAQAAANEKRKTSRRANTAERRATHNAVERQRRETLNGRFLDLAALLPNLTSVRRPSKSAIVNSSIALIHSQRRSRAIAARELRTLYSQFLALKAECDEWRARAGIPPVEEGERSGEWAVLMGLGVGEEEVEMGEEERVALRNAALASGGVGLGDEGEEEQDEGGYEREDGSPHGDELHHHHHHGHHQQVVVPSASTPTTATPPVLSNAAANATPAQIAHQQHLAQVHAAAQAQLQYHQAQAAQAQAQAQMQWQQQQQQQAMMGRGRSATFSHGHPHHAQAHQHAHAHGHPHIHHAHDIMGGIPTTTTSPFDGTDPALFSEMNVGGMYPYTHVHDATAANMYAPNIKSEWGASANPSAYTSFLPPLPSLYDESSSSASSHGSEAAASPAASVVSAPGGGSSPVHMAGGRSRASSLNLGAGAPGPVAPVPVPVSVGGGAGNSAMSMFY